jgi:hypothetical protein
MHVCMHAHASRDIFVGSFQADTQLCTHTCAPALVCLDTHTHTCRSAELQGLYAGGQTLEHAGITYVCVSVCTMYSCGSHVASFAPTMWILSSIHMYAYKLTKAFLSSVHSMHVCTHTHAHTNKADTYVGLISALAYVYICMSFVHRYAHIHTRLIMHFRERTHASMCSHVFIHACMHTDSLHTHAYTRAHTCMHAYTSTLTCVYVWRVHIDMHTYTCIHAYGYMYIHVHMSVHICIHIYIYIYIYIHTHTHAYAYAYSMYIYMNIYAHTETHTCAHMYMFICIYTHTYAHVHEHLCT